MELTQIQVSNISDQLDKTINLLITESAQKVSGSLLEQHPSHRTHSLRRHTPNLQPTKTSGQYTTLL